MDATCLQFDLQASLERGACLADLNRQMSDKYIPLVPGLVSAQRILEHAFRWPSPVIGIYFLIRGGDIVYVGQSTNVARRIQSHREGWDKAFDSVAVIECREEDLDVLEEGYIRMLTPLHNKKKMPRHARSDGSVKGWGT